MYQHHCCPTHLRTSPVVCPPQYRVFDSFIPREVPFIHPIVNVNRQHFADYPRHYFTQTSTTIPPQQTVPIGPGFGATPYGTPFGRPF